MPQNLDVLRPDCARPLDAPAAPPDGGRTPGSPAHARQLRATLEGFVDAARQGRLRLHLPARVGEPAARGDGHFHLAPELFLQQSGWTEFRFPAGACRLAAGEALVVPPQLRHAERVGPDGPGDAQAFRNVVVFAEGAQLSCHLAHERAPGQPGIAHLQSRRHVQAPRVHDWLSDATRLGDDGAWGLAQAQALVAAALAGVLRALDDERDGSAAEPVLIARLRVLVQNQLGDATLSVQRLAEQSGCSADHLSTTFRRTTGEALVAYVNRQRVERAQRLLRETRLAVKEIAWACGFASPSYFIRVFRRQHGRTPQQWRAPDTR